MIHRNILYILIISVAFSDIPIIANHISSGGVLYQASFFVSLILILSYKPIWQGRIPVGKSKWPLVWMYFFVVWLIISFFFNVISLPDASIQGQTPIFRFSSQILTLIFGFLVSITIASIYISQPDARLISQSFIVAIFITVVVGVMQIGLFIFNIEWISNFLRPIYFLFRQGILSEDIGRVSALMAEPSLLSILYVTSLPFLFISQQNKLSLVRISLIFLTCCIILASNSRTGWLAFFVQILFVLFFKSKFYINSLRVSLVISRIVIISVCALVFFSVLYDQIEIFKYSINSLLFLYDGENPFNSSNMIRSHAMLHALYIGLANPLFGVGFGGFPFSDPQALIIDSGDMQNLLTASSLYARLIAESGFPGLFVWSGFWYLIIYKLIRIACRVKRLTGKSDYYSFALATSCVGLSVTWLSNDSFAYTSQYLILGLSLGRIWHLNKVAIVADVALLR